MARDGTPVGQAYTADSGQTKRIGATHYVSKKVILKACLGQNAEPKAAQNNNEYVNFNIATQEIWKNDKGDCKNRTELHCVCAWTNLFWLIKNLQKDA